MAKPPPFNAVQTIKKIELKIGRDVRHRADEIAEAGRRGAEQEAKKLLVWVATTAMNHEKKPRLTAFSRVHWPPLKTATASAKGHKRFFKDTGWLIDRLKEMSDANKYYGPTRITVSDVKGKLVYGIDVYSDVFFQKDSDSRISDVLIGRLPNPVDTVRPPRFASRRAGAKSTSRKTPVGLHAKLLGPTGVHRNILAPAMYHFLKFRVKRAANEAMKRARIGR